MAVPTIPGDDPERRVLHDELHARPPVALEAPECIAHLALRIAPDDRSREERLLVELAQRLGLPAVDPSSGYLFLEADEVRVKWERHTEFTGLTVYRKVGAPPAESGSALDALSGDWLAALPGATLVAARVDLVRGAPSDLHDFIGSFGDRAVVGSQMGEGVCSALTDFRLRDDGLSRFVVIDHRMSSRQAGRYVQRLIEIETYRMMALLGLPVAKAVGNTLHEVERRLSTITERLAGTQRRDEGALLDDLTGLAAQIERSEANSRFRFGASAAYYQLVRRRIAELRESRLPGVQTIDEFLGRRLAPAMATCDSVARRQHELSERVARASQLLRTRVEVALERQNQSVLESMNRRVKLQLALQRTVEGFSIAAITYYVAGLVGYLAKAAESLGVGLRPEIATAAAIPLTVLVLWLALRRMRRRSSVD